jgi:hypothetical protein
MHISPILLSTLTIASGLGGEAPAPESFQGEPYIVLFTQANYRGTPRKLNAPAPALARAGNLRPVGSVTIGRGAWELCESENYTGRCVILDRNVANFALNELRTVQSVRPVKVPAPAPDQNIAAVAVFEQTNYRGSPVTVASGVPQVGSNQWLRSITIEKGLWEICDRPDYSGRCMTLTQSVPDFYLHGFRGRVRSLRPVVAQTHLTESGRQ